MSKTYGTRLSGDLEDRFNEYLEEEGVGMSEGLRQVIRTGVKMKLEGRTEAEEELERRISGLHSEIKDLEKEIERLEELKDEKDVRIQERKAREDALTDQIESLREENSELTNKIDELQGEELPGRRTVFSEAPLKLLIIILTCAFGGLIVSIGLGLIGLGVVAWFIPSPAAGTAEISFFLFFGIVAAVGGIGVSYVGYWSYRRTQKNIKK